MSHEHQRKRPRIFYEHANCEPSATHPGREGPMINDPVDTRTPKQRHVRQNREAFLPSAPSAPMFDVYHNQYRQSGGMQSGPNVQQSQNSGFGGGAGNQQPFAAYSNLVESSLWNRGDLNAMPRVDADAINATAMSFTATLSSDTLSQGSGRSHHLSGPNSSSLIGNECSIDGLNIWPYEDQQGGMRLGSDMMLNNDGEPGCSYVLDRGS
jgi:hypothetical protein